MTLHIATQMFTNDRMDWAKPHLNWVSNAYYRSFKSLVSGRK